jgi:hypothetical protein
LGYAGLGTTLGIRSHVKAAMMDDAAAAMDGMFC